MNNAIKYVKILESTGVSREQAEAHVQVLAEFLEGDLATKEDLLNSERNMRNAFERLENSVSSSIKQLDTKIAQLDNKIDTSVAQLDNKIETTITHLEGKILQSEYRMTIKLGSIVTVAIAAVAAVVKLL
jgi:hypothetical protein